eukprot:6173240-Pleurochrysis_carterae.AAC.4
MPMLRDACQRTVAAHKGCAEKHVAAQQRKAARARSATLHSPMCAPRSAYSWRRESTVQPCLLFGLTSTSAKRPTCVDPHIFEALVATRRARQLLLSHGFQPSPLQPILTRSRKIAADTYGGVNVEQRGDGDRCGQSECAYVSEIGMDGEGRKQYGRSQLERNRTRPRSRDTGGGARVKKGRAARLL